MRLTSVSIFLFCLLPILFTSCSQYKFVRAKPAKQKVEKTNQIAEKGKQIEAIALQEPEQNDAVEDHTHAIQNIRNEAIELPTKNEFSIENEDLEITESQNELNDQQYFEQILPDNYKATAIDSPTVNTNVVVPKMYNAGARDNAAKLGFVYTIAGIAITAIAIGLIFLASSITPFPWSIWIIAVFFMLVGFVVTILGLIFSLIGLQSENFHKKAKISLAILASVLLLSLAIYAFIYKE